ncbi:MAG TPA: PHP domain-containing protein [Propionicimonas sp.]|nr:PHP domain-containing protein [Propionicimonas sp.]HQA77867.1 PHP domain-containing protein [Propionicimonas sp.]
MRIDLHTHSNVSDGTDTPAELVAKASAALEVVALTDHDTFDGLAEAVAAGVQAGVEVLRGIEISAQHRGASVHLLGYGCLADAPGLAAELAHVREGRAQRVPAMLANLARYGMPVPVDVLARQVGDSPSVGRPHLADAMVELGYVADRREAFDNWLADDKPIFVHRYATELKTALRLIRQAGGVALVAHPWGRGSRAQLPPELLAELAASDLLDGVEVDHQDHDQATRADLRALAAELGLLATGSSDYHGAGKQEHDLGCNLTAPEVLTEIRRRVAERGGRL